MKIKNALLILFLFTFAFNQSALANAKRISHQRPSAVTKNALFKAPGVCEIEVANATHVAYQMDVNYDDGGTDREFIQPLDKLYIDLNFPKGSSYCQNGAYVMLSTLNGRLFFARYVYRGQTVHITPEMMKAFGIK